MDAQAEATTSDSLLRSMSPGDLFEIGSILAVAVCAVLIVERGLPPVAARLGPRASSLILRWVPVFRLGVLALTATLIIPIVVTPGSESLIGLIGAGAVAIGFAFKDYLTSIFAGILVLFERPYRQGDWVRIADVYGEIRDMGMRAVRIRTADDDVVTVPHGVIWTSMIYNSNDGAATLQCAADFYVHPEHDGTTLVRALGDCALASPWIDVTRPVTVLVRENPTNTHYRVKAYPISAADQFRFVTDITLRGKAVIAELGVRSPFTAFPAEAGT